MTRESPLSLPDERFLGHWSTMGRKLKPCGTEAAYRRHLRAGEQPCEMCAAIHRAEQLDRDRTPASLIVLPPLVEPEAVDPLDQARWALSRCVAAIDAQRPGLAGLLREHSRLVAWIVQLEQQAVVQESSLGSDEDERRAWDPAAI